MTDESRGGTTTTAQDWNSGTGRNDSAGPSKGRWKDSKGAGALRGAAAGSQAGTAMLERSAEDASSRIGPVASFKRGGKVRKTGLANLHKNERVIPSGKRKKVERLMKRSKMRMKARR